MRCIKSVRLSSLFLTVQLVLSADTCIDLARTNSRGLGEHWASSGLVEGFVRLL